MQWEHELTAWRVVESETPSMVKNDLDEHLKSRDLQDWGPRGPRDYVKIYF